MAGRPAIFLQTRFVTTTTTPANLKFEGIREAWVNGEPLPIASEPGRKLKLEPGTHVLTVKLTANDLPQHIRATCPEARFLTEVD